MRSNVLCGLSENVQNAVSAAAANVGKVAVVVGSSLMLAGVRTSLSLKLRSLGARHWSLSSVRSTLIQDVFMCRLPRR